MPLRSDRDSGALSLKGNTTEVGSQFIYTEGNIRALLQSMIICNDDVLLHHIMYTAQNDTCLSPVAQNALIEATAKVIQRHIVAEVCDVTFFSLLTDEITYFSRQEEISVCLRNVSDGTLKETLFVQAEEVDG